MGGLHILGSTRGMLPIGPNGIPAFDTLQPSPFTKSAANSLLPYNYSLDLQGISNNVSCSYAQDSPVEFGLPDPSVTYVYQFNGTCPPGQDFLGTTTWATIASNNSLGFWACETSTSSYNVYLRGITNYNVYIGNITCILEPVQPAIFKLDYMWEPGVFNSTQTAISTSSEISTELIRRAVKVLGNVRDLFYTLHNSNLIFSFSFQIIWQSQSEELNLVADSVNIFGIRYFQLPLGAPDDGYLRLYEAMIGDIIDYLVCFVVFLLAPFVR